MEEPDPIKEQTENISKCEQIPQTVKDQWEREQIELKKRLILDNSKEVTDLLTSYGQDKTYEEFYVGGVDISFIKGDNENACAAFIVLNFPQLEVVYEDCQMIKLTAPYIPGFLAFREATFLVDMYKKLVKEQPKYVPQVIMVDGNGILHPKEFGLACHLGVLLDTPCIGVAKKLFQVDGLENNVEHHLKIEQLKEGGDTFPLVGSTGKILGKALRSCCSTLNPVYVSVGHKITLDSAVELVHRCCKHRVPEPTRQADIKSREYLRDHFGPESQRTKNKGQKQKVKTKTIKTKHQQSMTKCAEYDVEDLFESCSLFEEDIT